jgi:hypothetical protein
VEAEAAPKEKQPGSVLDLRETEFKTQNVTFRLRSNKRPRPYFLMLLSNKYMLITEILEST